MSLIINRNGVELVNNIGAQGVAGAAWCTGTAGGAQEQVYASLFEVTRCQGILDLQVPGAQGHQGGTSTYAVPQYGIIIWSGASNAIPTGWVNLDGTNTPDLREICFGCR